MPTSWNITVLLIALPSEAEVFLQKVIGTMIKMIGAGEALVWMSQNPGYTLALAAVAVLVVIASASNK